MRLLPSRPVNFKEVWTTHICQLNINPNWTITQFLEKISPHISRLFNTDDFDIVEAGQYIPGIPGIPYMPAEVALALQITNIKLKDKWTEELNVSFYVRRRNFNYPQLQNLNIQNLNIQNLNIQNLNIQTNMIINPLTIDECPVCLETVYLINRIGCTHRICSDCNRTCQQMNYTICPLCRHV